MLLILMPIYQQAMTEAVNNLQFLGFKVRFLKPAHTTHPGKAKKRNKLLC